MQALSNIVAEGHNGNRGAFAAGGGGVTPTSHTVDFGTLPVKSKRFEISTPCTVGAPVQCVPTSVDHGDAFEFDGLVCAAHVSATDTVQVYIVAHPGPVMGERSILLYIG